MLLNQCSPKVWQSNEPAAVALCVNSQDYKAKGIRAVICPAFNVRLHYAPDLHVLILPAWDDTDVPPEWFDFAVRFHRTFGPTLVHCHGGLNRSVAFAAALLIDEGRRFEELTQDMATCTEQMRASVKRWAGLRAKP